MNNKSDIKIFVYLLKNTDKTYHTSRQVKVASRATDKLKDGDINVR